MLDYEGELTVIIGKDVKDISEADALSCILGYTTGNDANTAMLNPFDKFAPIGPCIVSPSLIPDPQNLSYTTKVNGEVRQETSTSDMIWTVKQLIVHLSRGTTLRAGTAIMTGTLSGVGLFMSPKGFLKDGDVVEVDISEIGAIANKMVF
ncbi:Uncharacterized protein LOCC1_G002241 [Lachnellula occidentalis]|uniref:Fumarylacetoacetase-like C-terminal domain-containing protein n=1 Tax=Lachnellula occidentalis TaxID=215460 RepID=A0A8H8UJS7_9HELO|nr:Uncharacterized protein LOCC1_G002241 [Lachnellula occidentalis]